jgi:hypothetical protein
MDEEWGIILDKAFEGELQGCCRGAGPNLHAYADVLLSRPGSAEILLQPERGVPMKTVSEVAHLFDVDQDVVKKWCHEFAEHLSPEAKPPKGQKGRCTEPDLRVLAVVFYYWEDTPDYENIHACLNCGDPDDEQFVEFARLHTPIFQEAPDDLTEDSHGALIQGMASHDMVRAARSFKTVLDELFRSASSRHEPHDLAYPIFYTCRHVLELYLKILRGKRRRKRTQNLEDLAKAVEAKYRGKLPPWIKDRILDFHRIDPDSDLFRFADKEPEACELWIDFAQLQTVMDKICEAFDAEVIRQGIGN